MFLNVFVICVGGGSVADLPAPAHLIAYIVFTFSRMLLGGLILLKGSFVLLLSFAIFVM